MILADLPYAEPIAGIYWCTRLTSQGAFDAGGEIMEWDVPEALAGQSFRGSPEPRPREV